MPPTSVRTIQTATSVPPVIAPIIAQAISRKPGNLDFAPIEIAPKIIVKKDAIKPKIAKVAICEDAALSTAVSFSAADAPSKPATKPPANNVTIAAIVPKIPPISATIPPDFFT